MRKLLPVVLATLMFVPAWSGDGEKVANFTLEDVEGKKHTLYDSKDFKAVVIFFIGVECPNVSRYQFRLIELHKAYAEKGVAFFAINSNAQETVEATRKHAREAEYKFPVLTDHDQKVADNIGVQIIPSAVILDPTWKVRYRGAIDDNKTAGLAKHHYVSDALDALLAGKEISPSETKPFGCLLQRTMNESKEADVTYAGQVARILNERCVSCHRAGQVAPFSLTSYESARRWAANIQSYTKSRAMPPWKPENHDTFVGERWMPEEEINLIDKWVKAGAPQGDPKKSPASPKFAEGWMMGEPDLVLTAPEYEVPAEGDDEYRCFVLPTDLPEDKWVSAVEYHPGNYRIVHHIIGYIDTTGTADKLAAKSKKPGYSSYGTGPGFIPSGEMSGWAPGNMPYALPDGVGRLLKKGARVVLEVHFHKNGRKEKDKTSVGLYFSKKEVEKRLRVTELINFNFRLPPGDNHHKVIARSTMSEDIHLRWIMPHMHLVGREVTVEAEFPDKTKKTLIRIADWDFNWQDTYHFKEPIAIPKRTRITATVYYDNSAGNPNNPNNPPKIMTWGEQTTDEMCITFLGYTRDKENLLDEKDK